MFLSRKWLQKSLTLIPINFNLPWWQLISKQKSLVALISVLVIMAHTFWSLSPFLIGRMFESGTITMCIALFSLWIFIDCAHVLARQLNARFQLQCIHSIYQSAHQYLLTIDPRYHVHRSSGAILGKIDRAARGYEEILDQVTFEFIPLLVGLVAMIGALSQFSILLAGTISFFFVLMIVLGYYFARYACQPWEKSFIATDDAFRSAAVENLAQVQLVRATFASDYMSHKLEKRIEDNMRSEGNVWLSYTTTSFILNIIYLIAMFSLLLVLVYQVNHGITSLASAVGLAIAYINSTKALVGIAKPFRRYMRGWVAVKDLFEFMPQFGKEGYPVLGDSTQLVVKPDVLSIQAHAISFDYETAQLFNNHTFSLSCSSTQAHKLYGIIGPSGSGKTTLLSILGGQLKPISGTVTINNIDIYAVTDAMRRQLIALQGQVATNVQGTVKYNLLFGLPEHHGYTDEYLLTVLERVGLLTILAGHKGLDTMLGESGLNLSGGQRQRLNFAGLYLRTLYYKPILVLIDEPTSSLDEISEAAITHMIEELAETSITLVIAHRLKTLEKAVGLIDLSLISKEKDIVIYAPEQLKNHSAYYNKLVQGALKLDS